MGSLPWLAMPLPPPSPNQRRSICMHSVRMSSRRHPMLAPPFLHICSFAAPAVKSPLRLPPSLPRAQTAAGLRDRLTSLPPSRVASASSPVCHDDVNDIDHFGGGRRPTQSLRWGTGSSVRACVWRFRVMLTPILEFTTSH